MNHQKIAMFIAVSFTFSTLTFAVNVNAATESIKSNSTNVSQITTGTVKSSSNEILSGVTMYSDNKNTNYANSSNTITLKFTSFRDLVKTPTVKINGVSLNATMLTPNTYIITYALINERTEGPITFSIDNLEDVSGLKSTKSITSVTTGGVVAFYNSSPTISDVWIDSNNSDKAIKSGSTIRLNFITNKKLSTLDTEAPVIKICNNLVIPNNITSDGTTYTASYILKDMDKEGYIDFEISNLTDLAGNINTEIINSVTSEKNIVHDKTPTVISNVTFSSNNSIPTLAKPKDTVSLEFDTDGTEFIATDVIIAGHRVKAVRKANTNHYKAEYTLDTTTKNGPIIYTFNGILDEAGNAGLPSTPSNASVLFDKTKLTITDIGLTSTNSSGVNNSYPNVSDTVNLTFTSSEKLVDNQFITINYHDCKVALVSGNVYSASYVLTQADYDANVSFKISSLLDYAGNKSETYTTTTDDSYMILDGISPAITIEGVTDNEFNNYESTDALITFHDNNYDPDSSITTINGNDISKYIKKTAAGLYSYNFHATQEGKYIIKAYAKDYSKNETTKNFTFTIDRTIPVTTINVNAPYVNKVFKPIITTGDPADNIFEVFINGMPVNPSNLPMLSINQEYTIEAISKDKAGNISIPTTSTFILDTIRPKINVSGLIQSFFYGTDVNPNITFVDANLLSSTMTLNGAAYKNSKLSKDGVYDLMLTAKDKASNINKQQIHFVIDKSSPTLEFKFPLNNLTFNTMIKPVLITQSKYGLDSISMYLDGEIYHGETIATEGKHSIIVTAKNKSGTATKKTFTFFIKTTPPIIRITNVEDGKTYKSGIIPEIYQEEAIKYDMTLNDKPYVFGQAVNTSGPNTLVIRATDTAENLATKTINFTVENKTILGAIKTLNPLNEKPQSSLPIIGGLIVLCLAGILGFLKFRSRKKEASN